MFSFEWPFIFLLFPLLWLMRLIPLSKKNEVMLKVPFLSKINYLNQKSTTRFFSANLSIKTISLIAWTLFIFACANPKWLGQAFPIKHDGHNIMFAIDLSPSMSIPDLQQDHHNITRLETVKEVARQFIDKRYGDKLGLILFASNAYLQTPLTVDKKTILHMLNDATIGLAGNHTAIGDAIGLAIKKLDHENIKSRIVILLTDGGNNSGTIDPLEAAELAKDQQIKIYTVGIGASKLMIHGFFNDEIINPSVDLDETLLKKIAYITKGEYFRAQNQKTLISILEKINLLEPISINAKSARPVISLFYWPLAGAFLLLLILIFPHLRKE